MEQDHRGIKQRYYPPRGFGSFASAARFCSAHDDLRDPCRSRQRLNATHSLADQRRLFQARWGEVWALLPAASQHIGAGTLRTNVRLSVLYSES
jgi:putative transposase